MGRMLRPYKTMLTIYQKLLDIRHEKGAGFLVLLDPDNASPEALAERAAACGAVGVDGLLVGGSLIVNDGFHDAIAQIKRRCKLPVIIFPGSPGQLCAEADAILFLSLISGRNPQHLIGDQVIAAPAIKRLGLEAIPTGYMLISSRLATAVEFMSNTRPLPRDKPDLAAAHALAGQYLGLKLIYLEAGSGATESVPDELISRVRQWVDLPLIVGGGIRDPQDAAEKVKAGADFVVVGTALENQPSSSAVQQFSRAVHEAGKAKLNR